MNRPNIITLHLFPLTAYLYRRSQLKENGLFEKDLPGLETEGANLLFGELDVLYGPGTSG